MIFIVSGTTRDPMIQSLVLLIVDRSELQCTLNVHVQRSLHTHAIRKRTGSALKVLDSVIKQLQSHMRNFVKLLHTINHQRSDFSNQYIMLSMYWKENVCVGMATLKRFESIHKSAIHRPQH